ncbi:DUF5107 domain-containing protein [Hungatella effluvii]
MNSKVSIWEEPIIIPTYRVHEPEKSPLFIEKRAYQGSTGKVYPLPVTEKISDNKENITYQAVYLENNFLKVMILPELGGRIHRAYDKTNGYDFVYYNHVIKPALVGLTGPWISGGIEFNWPQHHRPSTFSPVDYSYKENPDGSCTVFVSENDKMYGTKGMAAITLYPEKSYIEIKGQLYNPTDLPQTFLWWANPAVPVNDHTYSVFPPDVNAVMDHGKRAVSTFPIATGEYYKYDYSAGVDISRYKNVEVPTSYMAAHSDYDFIGNYDENIEAGLLHVADHHVSPGKKQWTWGNGDFGRTWDRNLTETDGPYIELMTGVFTDNQPDFTWLKPQEEKTFVQYFMPYKTVGRVGNATKDAAVSISADENGLATVKVYATGIYPGSIIKVSGTNSIVLEENTDLTPETGYKVSFPISEPLHNYVISVTHLDKLLVQYQSYEEELKPIPKPAEGMKAPQDMKSLEELYLAATHLEQYRHATYEPADYYLEGLKRDCTDIRLNNGYGLLLYKRGHLNDCISHFETAIKKQTWKTPNPYTGDCYFNLGIALETIGLHEKAYDAFYKSTWSAETQSPGFYWLACLACRKGQYTEALEFINKSLFNSWHNMKARNLKAALLRLTDENNTTFLNECLEIDPLFMGCLYENYLNLNELESWKVKMRTDAHNYLELSLDYLNAGLYQDALTILSAYSGNSPMVHYYKGYIYSMQDEREKAITCYQIAESCSHDYCFPNRVKEILILNDAVKLLKRAPMAHYYLGNLFYDKKQYENAVFHWEACISDGRKIALAYRNLSIAYYNKQKKPDKAMEALKIACSLEPNHARMWLEYDQLAAKLNFSIEERIKTMESHKEITYSRDDLYLRYITLLNTNGRYEDALSALMTHSFHPWEGGEGKVSSQFKYALIHLAKKEINENQLQKAIDHLIQTLTYPVNLGEGKLPNVPDNETYYYLGLAYKKLNDSNAANHYFKLATQGEQDPGLALYYNEQPSDFIYFQGLAHIELENENAAKKAFHKLISFGEKHLFDKVSYDYFAVSLPEIEVFEDNLQQRNEIYCNFLMALGHFGIGNIDKAQMLIGDILDIQKDYQGGLSIISQI